MTKQESTRVFAINAIDELMKSDPRYVVVFADSVKVFRAGDFAEKYADRVFDVGIAEQNSVAFASGLASSGLVPFVATYAGFLTMRACEQIRTFVGYPGLNVKILGANGGIFGGEREGVTHQFIEDIGIMRMIPGMTVISPADAKETFAAVKAAAKKPGPAYIRIGSGRDPVFHEEMPKFDLDKADVVDGSGGDAVIFAAGGEILHRAVQAGAALKAEGIAVSIVNVHTIKPIDSETVVTFLKKTGAAVTVEDHTVIGGLGSAIVETAADFCPVPVVRLGLQDTFAESGDGAALLDAYGMSAGDIAAAVRKALLAKAKHSRGK